VSDPLSEGPEFQILVPPELEGGVYANFVAVWHSAYEFTIDFCSTQPRHRSDPDAPVVVPCRAVFPG
jgi:hypothetical protein